MKIWAFLFILSTSSYAVVETWLCERTDESSGERNLAEVSLNTDTLQMAIHKSTGQAVKVRGVATEVITPDRRTNYHLSTGEYPYLYKFTLFRAEAVSLEFVPGGNRLACRLEGIK